MTTILQYGGVHGRAEFIIDVQPLYFTYFFVSPILCNSLPCSVATQVTSVVMECSIRFVTSLRRLQATLCPKLNTLTWGRPSDGSSYQLEQIVQPMCSNQTYIQRSCFYFKPATILQKSYDYKWRNMLSYAAFKVRFNTGSRLKKGKLLLQKGERGGISEIQIGFISSITSCIRLNIPTHST